MVTSGTSDAVITSVVHSEKTGLKKLMKMMIIILVNDKKRRCRDGSKKYRNKG